MIRFISKNTEQEVGATAATIMAEVIRHRPTALIGLATGSSPLNMYSALADMYRRGELSFSSVRAVNLDEYVGLSSDHPQSYAYFMRKNLFSHIDIKEQNCHIPVGTADPAAECERYDRLLDKLGRVDIQLLGLGHNGHIAFNEPDSHFPLDTIAVKLSDSTVNANSRFFSSPKEVPTTAISMGIGRILRAERILLIVTGQSKADILETALFGRITPAVPASILQFYQGELTVVGDTAAMSVVAEKHPYVFDKN